MGATVPDLQPTPPQGAEASANPTPEPEPEPQPEAQPEPQQEPQQEPKAEPEPEPQPQPEPEPEPEPEPMEPESEESDLGKWSKSWELWDEHWALYTGWPRKNATPTINNFKKTMDRIKKLCALMRIEFFSQQNDTKIINFDEGVLILWPIFWGNFIFKICHFCLKSPNWRTKNFHCLAPPGKVSALALKNEDSMNKEKHSGT